MRIVWTITFSAALFVCLSGHAQASQACVSKATEALPRIPGLVIKKSRVRPVSPEVLATWKGQTRPIIVDVDTLPQGTSDKLTLTCA
jgi:hypothetical protein